MEKTDAEKANEIKVQGNEHFKKKEYTKAIEYYTQAINLNPIEPSYYGNRAACYLGLNKFQKCIDDCNETLNIDPKFTKAWIRKARSNMSLGNFSEAQRCLNNALEIDPKDKAVQDELAQFKKVESMFADAKKELENNQLSGALMEVKQILRVFPDLIGAKIMYVEILARIGEPAAAIERSSEYLQQLATNTNFLYARGLALCYNGTVEMAKKTWQEALRLDPDNIKCMKALKRMNRQEEAKEKGNDAFKTGNLVKAVEFYTEGIETDPLNRNIVSAMYANRAAAYKKLKKYEDALKDCDEAIKLNSQYAKAYLRRGEINMAMGEFDEAKADFNQAHQIDPNLGARQKIKEAEIEAKKAARKDYYKILGVEKDVDDVELKKAYRKLALKFHPDKVQGTDKEKEEAEKKFKDISEAYSILSDPQKRARFDSGADLEDEMGGFGGGGAGGIDPNIIFQSFFGGGGGGGFDGFGGGSRGGGGFPGGFSFNFKHG